MKVKAAKSIAVKPAKKAAKAVKAKKPAKKTGGKTLKALLSEWDKDQGPGPNPYDVAQGFDDVCNRLSETVSLMEVALEDSFDLNERSMTLLCLAERILKETLEKANDLTSDLYKINRQSSSQ